MSIKSSMDAVPFNIPPAGLRSIAESLSFQEIIDVLVAEHSHQASRFREVVAENCWLKEQASSSKGVVAQHVATQLPNCTPDVVDVSSVGSGQRVPEPPFAARHEPKLFLPEKSATDPPKVEDGSLPTCLTDTDQDLREVARLPKSCDDSLPPKMQVPFESKGSKESETSPNRVVSEDSNRACESWAASGPLRQVSENLRRRGGKCFHRAKKRAPKKNVNVARALSSVAPDIQYTQESPYVINPEQNAFLHKWDQVTIFCLILVALVTPVEVAMIETELNALFFANRLIDLIFIFDMGLQFFIMYPVKTHFGMTMEGRHGRIVQRYLRGWFSIDFMSVQQFDLLGFIVESEELQKMKIVKVIRLLRLLKLARVTKASRVFRRLESQISINYQRVALYKFMMILMLISHWLSCLWAMTLTLVDDDEASDHIIPRWTHRIDELDPTHEPTANSAPHLYLASLYFVSYTITSVGYGDIGPVNTVERVVCTIMIFASGISWAYVLGQVCGIVSSMGMMEQEFRKSMDDLNYMMQDRELPHPMRRRLRSFFLSTKQLTRMQTQQKLLQKMSPALQGEVAMETSWIWLRKVPFMKPLLDKVANGGPDERTPSYIVDIAIALHNAIYAQSEIFGKPKILYILQKGLCSRRMRVLRSGAVWGEDFVLARPELMYSVTCYALTYVEVSLLGHEAFIRIVNRYRKAHPELNENIRKFACRMAVQRGMLLEARRLQIEQGVRGTKLVGKWLNTDLGDEDVQEW